MKTAATVGLRALAAARLSLTARLIEAALTIVGGTVGAVLGGAAGAAWWLAGMFWVEAAIWWWFFTRALESIHGPTRDVASRTWEPPRSERAIASDQRPHRDPHPA